MDRRRFAQAALLAPWGAVPAFTARAAAARNERDRDGGLAVLRVCEDFAETGFDPAKVSDRVSNTVLAHILEPLFHYDPLAWPVKAKPLTAAAMPEVADDFRTWTVRLTPGIFFADDPAFGGRPRELVAEDYVYAIKRLADPAVNSPAWRVVSDERLLGLEALRAQALATKRPFDYDTPIEGLRALDRHTLRFRLAEPRPRFLQVITSSPTFSAVAREVIERYRDDTMAHPVGTGPYRLAQWRRSSLIVLERNPTFREMRYDAEPAADDAEGQAWLARFKGRRLPLNDRVEITPIDEGQTRWLAFLDAQLDAIRVPNEFVPYAAPGGRLAPHLARRGITMRRYVNPDFTMSYFNMEDPVVGGLAPEKVALRRAIQLAYDIELEIRSVRRGTAIRAQAPMPPGTFGHDPALKTPHSDFDPARANALLDLYGWRDRDGDGWREQPDGSPLVLHMATQQSLIERQFDETWERSLRAIGIRIRFETAQWPENMKAARAGKLQMWSLGSTSTTPDGQPTLAYWYGPGRGSDNLARFQLDAFDAVYRRMLALPDNDERRALFREAVRLTAAYMPYRVHAHRIYVDVVQPWLRGMRRPLFRNEVWQYVEVDTALRERLRLSR